MQVKYKLWLEEDGQTVFGEGICRLLLAVQQTGSLNRAAAEMKMSYRQAWGKIKKIEQRLGCDLVTTQVGGSSGGGTELTARAIELVQKYGKLLVQLEKTIRVSYLDY